MNIDADLSAWLRQRQRPPSSWSQTASPPAMFSALWRYLPGLMKGEMTARDRTIRTFQIRVRSKLLESKLCQNSGNFVGNHRKSKKITILKHFPEQSAKFRQNFIIHFLSIFLSLTCFSTCFSSDFVNKKIQQNLGKIQRKFVEIIQRILAKKLANFSAIFDENFEH